MDILSSPLQGYGKWHGYPAVMGRKCQGNKMPNVWGKIMANSPSSLCSLPQGEVSMEWPRFPRWPEISSDNQRICILASWVTQVEVEPDVEGSMRESKGVAPLCHIVEGELTSIIIQENSYQPKRGLQEEGSCWGGKSPIFFPILQGHCPEYIMGGGQVYSPFSAYWFFTDTCGPLGFASHLYLPIMSPSNEAWRTHDKVKQIELLRLPGRSCWRNCIAIVTDS